MYNKSKFLKVSMKSSYPMIVYLRVRRFIGFISGFLKIWLTGLTIFTSFQGRNQIRTNVVVTFQFSNWEFSSLLFTHNYRNSQSESVIMSKVITSKRKKKTEIVHLCISALSKKEEMVFRLSLLYLDLAQMYAGRRAENLNFEFQLPDKSKY